MIYQDLGQSGYRVSRLCFGTLTMGPLCANLPLHEGAALLRAGAELGINFFDTAQQYQNYAYLAQAFGEWGPDIIIASKSYAASAEEMAWAVEEARIALRRDKIDIFLLHEVRGAEDFAQRQGALDYLHQAKANGIVGAVGLSTHDVPTARLAGAHPQIEILHAMFNQQGVGIRGGNLAQMSAACKAAQSAGKGVYAMKAIGGGALLRQAKSALCWAYQQQELDAIAVGMRDRAELFTNCAWLLGQEAEEAAQIKVLERQMAFDKEPACHKCGACVARCPQEALYPTADGVAWHQDRCLYCGYCIGACPYFCISFC